MPMTTARELSCSVEHRGDVTVVQLAGSLAVATTPVLRSAFLGCLADEPALIVLDVAGLDDSEDVALTVFPTLAMYAAAWPGSAVTLAAARPPLRVALDRMAVGMQVPCFASTEDALAQRDTAAGCGPGPLRTRLDPHVDATAAARHLVRRACRTFGTEPVQDLAELVVTELTSNVVRHAGTPMEIAVSHRRHLLHLSVRDGSHAPPRPGAANDSLSEQGRGLLVIEALTHRWGFTPTPDGKVVWASLRTR